MLTRLGFGPGGFPASTDMFGDWRRLQDEMNRLFSNVPTTRATADLPLINLWAGENSIVVTVELPGVEQDDLNIAVQEDVLTLSGKRQPPKLAGGENGNKVAWHRRERAYGEFVRAVQLPFAVDPDKVEARLRQGVLEIELRRPEAHQPRKIKISAS